MKKQIKTKILIMLFIIWTIITLSTNKIYAVDALENSIQGAEDFVQGPAWANADPLLVLGTVENMSEMIYNALFIVAIIAVVIVGLIIGIKFMTGSASEKAQVKETLIPYVVGCVVVFGAFGIWKLVINIFNQI